MSLPFLKMHGAGNDFVIFDARQRPIRLTPQQVQKIAARNNAVTKGCDQVIVMEPSAKAGVFMRIYNADGSEVGSCGNATRCVAWLVMDESGNDHCVVQTTEGLLECTRTGEWLVMVDMGAARLDAKSIPLAAGIDRKHIPLSYGVLKDGVAVGMGNPHIVYFVDDAETADLATYGAIIEESIAIFPERVNVSAAQVIGPNRIKLRVWERGAGLTKACGTAACATLVAAAEQGKTGYAADIDMPGGTLSIEWRGDGHVLMTGPVEKEFAGVVEL